MMMPSSSSSEDDGQMVSSALYLKRGRRVARSTLKGNDAIDASM